MTRRTSCTAPEQALLPDLLDRTLDRAAAQRVGDHAAGCAHCGPELRELREFEGAMRAAHLSPDEVVEAAWGGASPAEPHLVLCPTCRSEVAAVRSARLDAAEVTVRPLPRSGLRFAPLALAATVVIGAGLALWYGPNSVNRDLDSLEPATRGESVTTDRLSPQGEISRRLREVAFSWRGSSEGRYAILFFTEDGRPLARAETQGTRYVPGPEERQRLESQPVFFWKVESLDGAGSQPNGRLVRVSWSQ